jgi:hypothetical protein
MSGEGQAMDENDPPINSKLLFFRTFYRMA